MESYPQNKPKKYKINIVFNGIITLMKTNLLKILAILLATGGVVVGIAFWINKNVAKNNLSASVLKSFVEKDTDNDGLNDNMESVYGTDYKNPDSDGDGYLDGEEVMSGYDPLKPAPDDKLDTKYVITPRPAAGSIKNLNFTEDLVNKLTQKITDENIIPIKNADGSISLDDTDSAASSNIEDAMSAAIQRSYQEFSLPSIPTDQLNISMDNSADAKKEYSQAILNALKPIINVSVYEIEDGTKSQGDLINLCENTAVELKKIKTPSDAAALHKKQIGLLMIQANVLKSIANMEEDPLKATIAFSQAENINKISEDIFTDLQNLTGNFIRE